MYNRNDPRFRRTLNQISQNLESANESAQVGLFSLNEHCLKPCLNSVGTCVQDTTDTCFPRREDRPRRTRGRPRGRPELSFDFYDDWEEDENDALLAWGNDEFDRLLGDQQEGEPSRRGPMNYGSQNTTTPNSGARRKSWVIGSRNREDPTVIPNNSYFGFLDRLPFHYFGGRGLRYKPSAADLQERPKRRQKSKAGEDVLEEEREHQAGAESGKNGRQRSDTIESGHTTDSLSSRGDIFPSDEEDDAVPLDDEFAVALERRTTGSGPDDGSSGKSRRSKRSSRTKKSSRSNSSRSGDSSDKLSSISPSRNSETAEVGEALSKVPTLSELKYEEQQAEVAEEHEVEARREAAKKLAAERGLDDLGGSSNESDQCARPKDATLEDLGDVDAVDSSAIHETNKDRHDSHENIENQQKDAQNETLG